MIEAWDAVRAAVLRDAELPANLNDNRFVHSAPYDGKWEIDRQQPIMHYIATQILERF